MKNDQFNSLINEAYTDIMKRTAAIQRLKMLTPEAIEALDSFSCYNGHIWMTTKDRKSLHAVRPCFGKLEWDKSVEASSDNPAMQYSAADGPVRLILKCAELPPTCKIVEEEVEIPAQPAVEARMEKRLVVKCNEPEPVEVTQ